MARCPWAEWHGPADANFRSGGVVRPAQGCIIHVIVGSLVAADSVFHRSGYGASAHFGIGKDGRVWQWVDTNDRAWAEGAGNPYWISIETEGQPSEPLTNAQVASFGRLYRWCNETHGPFPYAVTDSPSGRGLGTHSMGGAAWGGHSCPGSIRAAQRPLILQVASGGQPTPPPQEEPVAHSWEVKIAPGEERFINIPWEDLLGLHMVAGAVGTDTRGAPPLPAYVVAGRPGGWYAPAIEGAETVIRSGRTLEWRFKKGDQGVSVINRANPRVPDHPELGPSLSFLFAAA